MFLLFWFIKCFIPNNILFLTPPPFFFIFYKGIENLYERALYIRKILLTIPRSVLIVMRYLFAFLDQ